MLQLPLLLVELYEVFAVIKDTLTELCAERRRHEMLEASGKFSAFFHRHQLALLLLKQSRNHRG